MQKILLCVFCVLVLVFIALVRIYELFHPPEPIPTPIPHPNPSGNKGGENLKIANGATIEIISKTTAGMVKDKYVMDKNAFKIATTYGADIRIANEDNFYNRDIAIVEREVNNKGEIFYNLINCCDKNTNRMHHITTDENGRHVKNYIKPNKKIIINSGCSETVEVEPYLKIKITAPKQEDVPSEDTMEFVNGKGGAKNKMKTTEENNGLQGTKLWTSRNDKNNNVQNNHSVTESKRGYSYDLNDEM